MEDRDAHREECEGVRHVDDEQRKPRDPHVFEHVHDVADEHAAERHDEQPMRGDAAIVDDEGHLQDHHDEERRQRGVRREDEANPERRGLVRERGCDQVRPRHHERGQRGHQCVEGRVEVEPGAAPAGAGDAGQPQTEQDVARRGEEVGDQRAVSGQVAERPELLPEGAADQEQEERGGHEDERPAAGGPVAPEADDGRGHGRGAQEHERVLRQRAEEPGPVQRDPAGSDDAHRERGALPVPIGVCSLPCQLPAVHCGFLARHSAGLGVVLRPTWRWRRDPGPPGPARTGSSRPAWPGTWPRRRRRPGVPPGNRRR